MLGLEASDMTGRSNPVTENPNRNIIFDAEFECGNID